VVARLVVAMLFEFERTARPRSLMQPHQACGQAARRPQRIARTGAFAVEQGLTQKLIHGMDAADHFDNGSVTDDEPSTGAGTATAPLPSYGRNASSCRANHGRLRSVTSPAQDAAKIT